MSTVDVWVTFTKCKHIIPPGWFRCSIGKVHFLSSCWCLVHCGQFIRKIPKGYGKNNRSVHIMLITLHLTLFLRCLTEPRRVCSGPGPMGLIDATTCERFLWVDFWRLLDFVYKMFGVYCVKVLEIVWIFVVKSIWKTCTCVYKYAYILLFLKKQKESEGRWRHIFLSILHGWVPVLQASWDGWGRGPGSTPGSYWSKQNLQCEILPQVFSVYFWVNLAHLLDANKLEKPANYIKIFATESNIGVFVCYFHLKTKLYYDKWSSLMQSSLPFRCGGVH